MPWNNRCFDKRTSKDVKDFICVIFLIWLQYRDTVKTRLKYSEERWKIKSFC